MGEPVGGMTPSTFWRLAFAQAAEGEIRWRDHTAEEVFWREYAPGYDERSPLAQRADALVTGLLALLQPSDRLLEIGPGSGAFTRRIAGYVGEIAGVEPSMAMRAELLRRWEPRFGDTAPALALPLGGRARSGVRCGLRMQRLLLHGEYRDLVVEDAALRGPMRRPGTERRRPLCAATARPAQRASPRARACACALRCPGRTGDRPPPAVLFSRACARHLG